jgi:predicted transcriptional regulator
VTRAKFKAATESSYQLLEQVRKNRFDDIVKYRSIQLALEEEVHNSTEYKQIDFVLSNLVRENPSRSEYGPADLEHIPESQYEQMLQHCSQKMKQELETYEKILELLNPPQNIEQQEEKQSKAHTQNEEGNTKIETLHDTVERNYKTVARALRNLPEETSQNYTTPLTEDNSKA